MSELSCANCAKLEIKITKKDKKIKKLTIQVQNLKKSLNFYESQSCLKCYCPKVNIKLNEKCMSDYKSFDTTPVTCSTKNVDKLEETEKLSASKESNVKNDENICNSEANNTFQSSDEYVYDENYKMYYCVSDGYYYNKIDNSEANNAFQSSDEYVYDENYKMYYCVSTGYYYDNNTGLYYIPQNGAYYTYDYSKNVYVLYDGHNTVVDLNKNDQNSTSVADASFIDDTNKEIKSGSSKADDSCESVVDQVNNLNINDTDCSISVVSPKASNCMLSKTNVAVEEENTYLETDNELSNIWGMPLDSKQTIHDLVREVAEQNSGTSDYIYDEKYQMYYSTTTGYYYDAVRKLLYDPQSGIYYTYDEDTSFYDFYYQVDLNAVETDRKTKQAKVKVRARRRYWRKKLNIGEEKCPDSKKYSKEIDKHEEIYSSPEEGELFSSESDQDTECPYKSFQLLENSIDDRSPCIRAIVKGSTKLKTGTLLLITYLGAIIGKDKTNSLHIPETSVSKTHAEVSFDNELWKYVIKDLGSQNGTFVNDSRLSEPKEVSSPCVLNHGDIVTIGSCKLMFHIHVGRETCDECEPGLVMAEKPSKGEKLTAVFKTKEEKEKERRKEVKRLKKKYGLQNMGYEKVKDSTSISGYEDKADIRRKTVGSENPYEKTETSSLERTVNESNKGYQMLKKLGWREGDSLGATGLGISEPVPLRPWLSKAGLGSSEEHKASMLTTQDKRNEKWILAQERFLKLT